MARRRREKIYTFRGITKRISTANMPASRRPPALSREHTCDPQDLTSIMIGMPSSLLASCRQISKTELVNSESQSSLSLA
mgnify:CR=1 FL=1